MRCTDCLGRTPFGSLIATIICCLGVGLFCGTLYEAVDITLRSIFEGLFLFRVPWLETIMILFIVVAVVMGCFAIMLLTFGFLATGATRQNIYSGVKCIMGGRISAAFFVVLTYILNIFWILMSSSLTIPIFMFVMLKSICEEEIEGQEEWVIENYCLNLSRFGIYRNYTENVDQNALCTPSELSQFCRYVTDAGPMYGLAFGGSLLIVLALVNYLIILSANYHRIKVSKELSEYRDAVDMEIQDDQVFANPKTINLEMF